MAQKDFKLVLQLLLLSSCILSLFAAPLPRSIALMKNKVEHQVWRREMVQVEEEGMVKGRMNIEVDDYSGGPNTRHDPRHPPPKPIQ